MSTVPFSYYLFHRPTKQHYYGVKFARGCHPNMLWSTYFSSSGIIKKLIKEYGADSFDVKIRKIFKDGQSALLWEHKVLRRLDASSRPDWINRHNGGSKFRSPLEHSSETKQSIAKKITGMTRSEETRKRMSQSAAKREERRRGWKMPKEAIDKSLETRNKRIEAGVINPYSNERNLKMGASKRGCKRHYLPDGSFIMVKPQELQ